MASFYGTETYSIDNKGRLGIPPAWRRAARGRKGDTRFFLKYGSEGCLQLYPPDVWAEREERLRQLLRKDPRSRSFVRAFTMDAVWVTADAQGRIGIPPALLSRAGLGKEAVLHGTIDFIEVWTPEKFASVSTVDPESLVQGEFDYLKD